MLIKFDDSTTASERYSPAMEITNQKEADEYLEALIDDAARYNLSRQRAEEIERKNLAYFAGYYSDDIRRRVEKLFNCVHPVFGAIELKK